MQTRGLGDRKGVRPGSGLKWPFHTAQGRQEAAARSRHRLTLSLSEHRVSRRAYDLHMMVDAVDAAGAARAQAIVSGIKETGLSLLD